MSGKSHSLAWLPLITGLLPIVVVIICYVLSEAGGHVGSCIPFLEGCTTISAAGRHGMAYFVFKGGIIPSAVLIALFWPLCRRWFLSIGGEDSRSLHAMVWLGMISAAFLILYAVFLGSKGDFYSLMRRYGVTVHFSFSYLAQLLLLDRLTKMQKSVGLPIPRYITRWQFGISVAMLVMGLISIPVEEIIPDPGHRIENTIEWNFALLLSGWYLLAWRAWSLTGFTADFRSRSG